MSRYSATEPFLKLTNKFCPLAMDVCCARAHLFTSRLNNEHMNEAYVSTVNSNRNHKMQKIDTHLSDRKTEKDANLIRNYWMLVYGV